MENRLYLAKDLAPDSQLNIRTTQLDVDTTKTQAVIAHGLNVE